MKRYTRAVNRLGQEKRIATRTVASTTGVVLLQDTFIRQFASTVDLVQGLTRHTHVCFHFPQGLAT